MFTIGSDAERAWIERGLDLVGIEYDIIRTETTNRATEAVPLTDALVVGRVLDVLGASIGAEGREFARVIRVSRSRR